MRVTQPMMMSQFLNTNTSLRAQEQKLTEQLSTGLKINRPSDDPGGFAIKSRLSDNINGLERFNKSIDFGMMRAGIQSAAYEGVREGMQNIREKLIERENGTFNSGDKQVIADEVMEMVEGIKGLINTQDENGAYVFSGVSENTPPLDGNNDLAYGPGQRVIQIGQAANVKISEELPQEMADLVKNITNSYYSGTLSTGDIEDLDAAMDAVMAREASIGSKINRMDVTKTVNTGFITTMTESKSKIEDVDLAEAITKLTQNQSTLEIAMQAFQKTNNLSLFKYI